MANITAKQVNELRQLTGVGMMDCKKALVECDGDFEKAIDFLRQKGQKMAAKRADRDANEGCVLAKTNGTYGAVIMVSCETDFVATNADFVAFTTNILDNAMAKHLTTKEQVLDMELEGRKVSDCITDQIAKIGEKIELAHFETIEADAVYAYIHPGNRMASVVGMSKTGYDEVGHNIAMQVVAMRPLALDANSIPQEVNAKGWISEEQVEMAKKIKEEEAAKKAATLNEKQIEQIAQGRLNKFFKENTLVEQEYIMESKMTVRQFIESTDKELSCTGFKRLELGA